MIPRSFVGLCIDARSWNGAWFADTWERFGPTNYVRSAVERGTYQHPSSQLHNRRIKSQLDKGSICYTKMDQISGYIPLGELLNMMTVKSSWISLCSWEGLLQR